MQIKMLASRFAAGGALSYVAGTTYEVANDLALQFIGDNAAVEVNGSRAAATDCLRDEFSKPEGIAGIALVSEAGNARTFARVVTFGDSITHNAVYSSQTPDAFGVSPATWFGDSATDNYFRSWSWAAWIGPMSMQRIQWAKNYAVQTNGLLYAGTSPVGNPLSLQVTRYLAEAASIGATRAAIMIGTNDTGFTVQQCVTELLTQIARLNIPVDLISVPPRGGTVTGVVGEGMQFWAWLQNWRAACRRIASESRGKIRFIDAYSLGNTPGSVPDVMLSTRTYDNIHTNNAYAYLIADAYVSSLLPPTLAGDLDLWPNNSNAASAGSNNLLDQGVINPIMTVASGGTNFGAGTVAGNYTLAAVAGGTLSAGASVIANPNGLGNMQRIPIRAAAAGDGVTFTTDSFHAQGGTFLSAGDECYGQALVTVNAGGIFPRNIRINLNINNGSTPWNRMLFEIDATKEIALPIAATRSFLLRTPRLIMPAGYTSISTTVSVRATMAAAGDCTIDVGNMSGPRIRAGGVYA